MANKITKKEMFTMIMALDEVKANTQFVDFIQHEIELLEKKASGKRETATQKANMALKEIILEVLATGEKLKISEIQERHDELKDLSNQKMSALLRQLKDDEHKVAKEMDKKTPLFYRVWED